MNHFELDRLGVVAGDVVTVTGPRASAELPVALDNAVPSGALEVAFGSLDEQDRDVVRPLMDSSNVIVQVRLETR